TKWRVLGTTILNDKVNEAVAGANIRVLSAIGVDRMREMTKLRVASANEKSAKQDTKGEKKMKVLKIEDVRAKFDGYTVLGVNGLNVALLSDKGRTCSYTFLENEDTVVPERINEIAVNSIFGEGEDSVSVNVEDITCVTLAKLASANQAVTDLTREKGELEARVNALEAEKLERNKADIKSAMERHLEEIKANCKGISVDCSAIMTDECISEYAKLVGKDGKPCGSEMACKDIDTRCMSEIVAQSKVKANSQVKFAWEDDFNGQPTVKTNSSVEKILE
ncbi:MAG: hypothetical protein KBS59_04025, partial [Clostridiales bacterium]|nr:hypothetical protein [Clostridiales bacterium]